MRATALDLEQRRGVNIGLIHLAGVLGNKLADHLKMAELLHRDVLQHIADAGILDMEGLHPILERRGQFTSCTAELLK